MAKDPAFLFYPGDYLRDTQCLSEPTQTAYDRIMCEHMRNICISQEQLNFFTKRLNSDQKFELMQVLKKIPGGFQIEWVADSIEKRKNYSDSRRKNREGKGQKTNKISSTYVSHMENENEIVIEDESKYIMVDGEKIFDPMRVIEFYEAQLNGTQKEFGNLAWRPLVPEWFGQHIGEDFKDGMHVKNSFKKFYIQKYDRRSDKKAPNGAVPRFAGTGYDKPL